MPVISQLLQRHVDAFYANIPEKRTSAALFADLLKYAGTVAKAARAAGWYDPDPGDIDNLPPGKVVELAKEASEAYGKSLSIDPS